VSVTQRDGHGQASRQPGPFEAVGAENLCHQAIFMNHAPCAVTPLDPDPRPCGVPKPRSRLLTCSFLNRPTDPPAARQASSLCEVHDRYSAGIHPARVRHRRSSSRLTQERAREREAIMGERHRRSHSVLPRAVSTQEYLVGCRNCVVPLTCNDDERRT
jgi:hypothetical protein